MNKHEKKYKNTTEKIYRAFLELLEEKDFSEISITDICKRESIARTTFYLHYSNVIELADELASSVYQRFYERQLQDISLSKNNPTKALLSCLAFIQEHRRLYRIILQNPSIFHRSILGQNLLDLLFNSSYPTENNLEGSLGSYYSAYYIAGISAVISMWIDNNCSESIDTIVNVLLDCFR